MPSFNDIATPPRNDVQRHVRRAWILPALRRLLDARQQERRHVGRHREIGPADVADLANLCKRQRRALGNAPRDIDLESDDLDRLYAGALSYW